MAKILLEACCGSVRDVIIADRLKFDMIELNSSLENEGMTPSVGTLIMAKQLTNIPIYTMVRARPKGFDYTEEDYQAMLIDAKVLIENGADGIVFGFLNEDATINVERTKAMINIIGNKQAIFHKAFDSTKDLIQAIEILIDLGVDRVLTGGGVGDISNNIEMLKTLQSKYGHKIDILVGGGVRSHNIQHIIRGSNINKVHFSGSSLIFDNSTYETALVKNKDDYSYVGVDEINMRSIIDAIRKVGDNND